MKKNKKATLPKNFAALQTSSTRKTPNRVEEWRRNVRQERNNMSRDAGHEFGAWNSEHQSYGAASEPQRQEIGGMQFYVIEEETSWLDTEDFEERERIPRIFDLDLDLDLDKRWWYPVSNNASQRGHVECSTRADYWEGNTPVEYVYVANFDMWQQPDIMHIPMDIPIGAPSSLQQTSQFDLRTRHERLVNTLGEVIRRIDQVEFRYSVAYMTHTALFEEMLDTTYGGEYRNLLSTREQLLKELEIIENEVDMYGRNNVPPSSPQTRRCQCQCAYEEDLPRPSSPSTQDPPLPKTRSTSHAQHSTSTKSPVSVKPKAFPLENPRLHLEKYNQKWKDLLQSSSNTNSRPSQGQLPWPTPSPTFSRTSLLHPHPSSSLPSPATPSQLSKWTVHQFFCHAFGLVPVSHPNTNTNQNTQAHAFGFSFPDSNNSNRNTAEKIRCLEGLRKQLKMEMVRWHEDKLRLLVGEEGARDEMVKVVWAAVLELRGRVEEEIGRLMM